MPEAGIHRVSFPGVGKESPGLKPGPQDVGLGAPEPDLAGASRDGKGDDPVDSDRCEKERSQSLEYMHKYMYH